LQAGLGEATMDSAVPASGVFPAGDHRPYRSESPHPAGMEVRIESYQISLDVFDDSDLYRLYYYCLEV